MVSKLVENAAPDRDKLPQLGTHVFREVGTGNLNGLLVGHHLSESDHRARYKIRALVA
jgi:hypothetical protein